MKSRKVPHSRQEGTFGKLHEDMFIYKQKGQGMPGLCCEEGSGLPDMTNTTGAYLYKNLTV